jgi:signal transduction histidine kinase
VIPGEEAYNSLTPANAKSVMQKVQSLERFEAQAFKRQQTAFSVLTLFVLAVLLVLHTLFASLLGEPQPTTVVLLGGSFSLKFLEIIWLQGKKDGISERTAFIETILSSVGIFLLSILLAYSTNRDDPPYFVLLAIPILQIAYQLSLGPTLLTIAAAIGMMFAWIQHYFAEYPPPRPTEYLETAMIAVIYCVMGPLVWYLANHLKQKQTSLYEKMAELESTREKLVAEEKLAAVGRLASGIAHEIRNPVAMISSALATANSLSSQPGDREEMFMIAAREAKRLERLTGEFLSYARPVEPKVSPMPVDDILGHIADITRMRASGRVIEVTSKVTGDTTALIDPSQIEAALLNLSLNALDAIQDQGTIELRCRDVSDRLCIDVENSGARISDDILNRIFEPFFTTKPHGTGLGLATARGVAIAHGGDLFVSNNQDGAVVFTMILLKNPAT